MDDRQKILLCILLVTFLIILVLIAFMSPTSKRGKENILPIAEVPNAIRAEVNKPAIFSGIGRDADGWIVYYEWDFDGDELYDWSSNDTGIASHTYYKVGTYNAKFRVTDNKGGKCSVTVSVVANAIDSIKAFYPKDDIIIIEEGKEQRFWVVFEAIEIENINIEWFLDTIPVAEGKNYTYKTSYNSAGEYVVFVQISDGMLRASHKWDVKVENVNRAPVILEVNPSADVVINEGEETTFNVFLYDPDDDVLKVVWYIDGVRKPPSRISKTIFTYKSDYNSSGTHEIKVLVSDFELCAIYVWNVTVLNINRAPYIIDYLPKGNVKIREGESITMIVIADDLDEDVLTYKWKIKNVGVKEKSNTYTFIADYHASSRSPYKIEVEVCDGMFNDTMCWQVIVENVNRPPEIISVYPMIQNIIINETENLTFTVVANDPDGDRLFYKWHMNDSLISNKESEECEYTYTFRTNYSSKSSFPYKIMVVVADDGKPSLSVNYTWNVYVRNKNRPPVAVAGEDQRVCLGDYVYFDASFSYDPDNDSLTYYWDFGDNSTANGVNVSHLYEVPTEYTVEGITYTVTLKVSDSFLEEIATCTVTLFECGMSGCKPVLYLYREKPALDNVKVKFTEGSAEITIPDVGKGKEIEWRNVGVGNGKLAYNGMRYDYLFYEGKIYKDTNRINMHYGWVIERNEKGILRLNDEEISYIGLREFFVKELREAGLYENEIKDFVDFWLTEKERLFFGKKEFRFAILYLPQEEYERMVQIETKLNYESIVRVLFIVMPTDGNIVLQEPIYIKQKESKNSLHEWGLIVYKIDISGMDFTEGIESIPMEETNREYKNSTHASLCFVYIPIAACLCIYAIRKVWKQL
ncbi:MAG: PKD domain-containing protein [Candidatus Thermoplasmatota archaeon]